MSEREFPKKKPSLGEMFYKTPHPFRTMRADLRAINVAARQLLIENRQTVEEERLYGQAATRAAWVLAFASRLLPYPRVPIF